MQSETLIAIICLVLSAIFGVAIGEITDDKIVLPILEKSEADDGHAVGPCPDAIILAYTEDDKYLCECVGADCPCIKTEEILSQLG